MEITQPPKHERKDEDLPTWAVRAVYRMAQLAQQPGEYSIVFVVTEDGRKQLRVTIPPKTEELGE